MQKRKYTYISKYIYIYILRANVSKRSKEKARENPVNRHKCGIRVRVNGLWITHTKIRLKIHSIRIDWPESVFHFNTFSHSDSRKCILTLQYFPWQRCLPSGFWHIFYSLFFVLVCSPEIPCCRGKGMRKTKRVNEPASRGARVVESEWNERTRELDIEYKMNGDRKRVRGKEYNCGNFLLASH